MRKILFIFFLTMYLLSTIGCSRSPKIELIDSLPVYNFKNNQFGRLSEYLDKPAYKIVTYIDGACINCATDFIAWNNIIKKARKKDLVFIFYLNIKDFEEIKPFFRRWRFYEPVTIDKTNSFAKKNNIGSDKAYHSFILDKNNNVMYNGNPLYSTEAEAYYLNFITQK